MTLEMGDVDGGRAQLELALPAFDQCIEVDEYFGPDEKQPITGRQDSTYHP